jgi:hypothetical protein
VPDDPEFRQYLHGLQAQRLLGLAASAVSTGTLTLTSDQADQLVAAHAEAMCGCLLLEATLLDVQSALLREEITPRVIKGPASAHLDYADPGLRCFGDLDILVRSADFDRTKSVLNHIGFARSVPEPRDGFDRRFGKGATFVAADGTNVDLHRTFVMGPFGLKVDLDELWAVGETFTLAGRDVEALTAEHRLLAACYNAILGDRVPRLSTLRDIAQLCLSGEVDANAVVATADRWGACGLLARGINATWDILEIADVISLSAWSARHQDGPGDELLDLYHDPQAGYSGLSWATARMLPPGQRIAFLAALAFPQGGRLGKGGWRLTERMRRAARGYARAQR